MEFIVTWLGHLYTAFMVLLLFGITIFVHELGHYLAARWMGLKIDAFSIGFGPAIWKTTRKGIVYKIGCLPFGGYVALPQLDPELGLKKEDGSKKRDVPPIAAWRKIPVLLAGVTGNVVLAFLIAVCVFVYGRSGAVPRQGAVIGSVDTNSAAYAAGLRTGMRILRVNGRDIKRWDQLVVDATLTDRVALEVLDHEGNERSVSLKTQAIEQGGRQIHGLEPSRTAVVFEVAPGSSADRAGLMRGDRLLSLDGQSVHSVPHLIRLVNTYGGQTVPLEIERDGVRQTVSVTPTYNPDVDRALIGVQFNPFDISQDIYATPWEQMVRWGAPVFRILKALVTPKEAGFAAASVGGPAMILKFIWISLKTSFLLAIWVMGMINVNLAILNLLPIPVLDGGHLVFTAWEIVFRKPLPPKLVIVLSNIFAVLLIGVMLFITYRDLTRSYFGGVSGKGANGPPAEAAVTVTNAP